MTTQGKVIQELCRGMRQLNEEVCALLRTADKRLSECYHYQPNKQTVIKDTTKSLDEPTNWAPVKMYRRYRNSSDQDDVIVLNIFLYKLDVIEEPLILCGRFKYQKDQANHHWREFDAWRFWKCGAVNERKLGKIYTKGDRPKDVFLEKVRWSKEKIKAIRTIRLIAVPLCDMQNSKSLDDKVFHKIL